MPDVTFFSDQFSQTPSPDAINETLGHDLAAWLHAGLAEAGFEVSEVITEDYDYGFGFWLETDGSHYWLTQTQYEPAGYNDQAQPKWLVGIHDDPGCLFIRRARRRPNPQDVPRIAQAVHLRLLSEPAISGIQWWAEDVGSGTPTSEPPSA